MLTLKKEDFAVFELIKKESLSLKKLTISTEKNSDIISFAMFFETDQKNNGSEMKRMFVSAKSDKQATESKSLVVQAKNADSMFHLILRASETFDIELSKDRIIVSLGSICASYKASSEDCKNEDSQEHVLAFSKKEFDSILVNGFSDLLIHMDWYECKKSGITIVANQNEAMAEISTNSLRMLRNIPNNNFNMPGAKAFNHENGLAFIHPKYLELISKVTKDEENIKVFFSDHSSNEEYYGTVKISVGNRMSFVFDEFLRKKVNTLITSTIPFFNMTPAASATVKKSSFIDLTRFVSENAGFSETRMIVKFSKSDNMMTVTNVDADDVTFTSKATVGKVSCDFSIEMNIFNLLNVVKTFDDDEEFTIALKKGEEKHYFVGNEKTKYMLVKISKSE